MSILYEYYNTGQNGTDDCYDSAYMAMLFTPQTDFTIEYVKLLIKREGTPGDVTVSIKAVDGDNHPIGADLASVTVVSSTISDSPAWVTFTFDSTTNLITDTVYAIIMKTASGNQSNAINWYRDDSSPTYTRGNAVVYTLGNWVTVARDSMFETWGVQFGDMAASGGGTSAGTAVITVGEAEGTEWPEERPTIDSGLRWDELSGTWVSSIVGLGRHKTSVIAVGQGNANEGVIYFGAI